MRRSTTEFLLVHWMALVLIGAFVAAPPKEMVGSGQQACLMDAESPGPGPSLHKLAEGTFACAELPVRDEQAPPIVGEVAPLVCREHHAGGTSLQAAGVRLQV